MPEQKNYHPILRKVMAIGAIILLLCGLISLYWHKDITYNAFKEQQQKTRHILIDKIDDVGIYLILYNGDTLGVVAVK